MPTRGKPKLKHKVKARPKPKPGSSRVPREQGKSTPKYPKLKPSPPPERQKNPPYGRPAAGGQVQGIFKGKPKQRRRPPGRPAGLLIKRRKRR